MPDKLPSGWVKTNLEAVCLPVASIRPEDFPGTEFTYFDIGGIDNEKNRIADTKIVSGRNAPSRARQVTRKDDILFSTVRTYLRKIARVELDYSNPVASTGFTVIRPAEGVSSQFLFFQILSDDFLQPLHELQSGTSYPAVRDKDVLSQPILLPPAREQERIVTKLHGALSAVQRAETAANRARERLDRYRIAVLHAAVSGELTRDWREEQQKNKGTNIETGETVLHQLLTVRRNRWEQAELKRLQKSGETPGNHWQSRYPEPARPTTTDLPELPGTWAWASLDMISEIGSGISVSQNRRVENPVALPYLRVANVLRGFLDLSDIRTIRMEKDQTEDYLLHVGDILFTEGGDRDKLGRGWIWEGQIHNCVHQNHVFRARTFDSSLTNPKLISHWGNTFGQRFFLAHGKQTTNLASINRSVLGKLPVPIAPAEEQVEIIREVELRLTAADKLAATLDQQLARARASHQSLLQVALSGRLVPQDQNDEPASALLERIRTEKVRIKAQQDGARRELSSTKRNKGSDPMQEPQISPELLKIAWEKIGRIPDARRLFDEAGFDADHVVQFYEALRGTPELRVAFQEPVQKVAHVPEPPQGTGEPKTKFAGSFRLVELWLEDFKNLKDYKVLFDPAQGLDIVLGWNGTGKSNLFEALVIIFRDLHGWWEKNRWPEKPLNSFRLAYEIDDHAVEVTWRPSQMRRPEVKRGQISRKTTGEAKMEPIKREQLPLPRFVFGYYSGPTNRLAEHFLPMKQDHYERLRLAKADDPKTLAKLLEQRRFFCAETHHAKYVLLGFSYKEDQKISEFLENRLRIVGFESALFIIRRPPWAKSGSKPEDFWGATGIMRRVMERLRCYAIAPMVLQQKVSFGYRSTTEDHYYFFLPDLTSLHSFAAEYQDARSFFLALESTDFSELIHDVKIQVRVKSTNTEQVSITFHQLSEGEQQLLMVLGLMRFTKSHQSLVLLDEPDTHLNPHWSVDYVKDLARVMSDNSVDSTEQQTSQILMATHDPLVIASLVKEQIHLLKRDTTTGACKWEPASVNPRGLGFTGILTSEMFGFRSDLDPETLFDLDTRVRLIAREGSLNPEEKEELEMIDKRLAGAGFSKAFSDPYYAAFVRAWGRRYSLLMEGQQFLTPEKRQEIDRIASEVLKEAVAEVEKGAGD